MGNPIPFKLAPPTWIVHNVPVFCTSGVDLAGWLAFGWKQGANELGAADSRPASHLTIADQPNRKATEANKNASGERRIIRGLVLQRLLGRYGPQHAGSPGNKPLFVRQLLGYAGSRVQTIRHDISK